MFFPAFCAPFSQEPLSAHIRKISIQELPFPKTEKKYKKTGRKYRLLSAGALYNFRGTKGSSGMTGSNGANGSNGTEDSNNANGSNSATGSKDSNGADP